MLEGGPYYGRSTVNMWYAGAQPCPFLDLNWLWERERKRKKYPYLVIDMKSNLTLNNILKATCNKMALQLHF